MGATCRFSPLLLALAVFVGCAGSSSTAEPEEPAQPAKPVTKPVLTGESPTGAKSEEEQLVRLVEILAETMGYGDCDQFAGHVQSWMSAHAGEFQLLLDRIDGKKPRELGAPADANEEAQLEARLRGAYSWVLHKADDCAHDQQSVDAFAKFDELVGGPDRD